MPRAALGCSSLCFPLLLAVGLSSGCDSSEEAHASVGLGTAGASGTPPSNIAGAGGASKGGAGQNEGSGAEVSEEEQSQAGQKTTGGAAGAPGTAGTGAAGVAGVASGGEAGAGGGEVPEAGAEPYEQGLIFPETQQDGVWVVVSPKEIDAPLRNPGVGWLMYDFAPMTAPGGATECEFSSEVYSNLLSWGDIEPFEDTYAWYLIDAFINAYPGRKVRFGITLLDPTSRPWYGATGHGQVPTWLSAKLCPQQGPCRGRWAAKFEGIDIKSKEYVPYTKADENSLLFEPHYWDPYFLERHQKFIRALARRYFDNSPEVAGYPGATDWTRRVSAIDIATYGLWGEWHSDIPWPDVATKRATLRAMIDHFYDAFAEQAALAGRPPPLLEQSTVGSTLPDNDIYANADPSGVLYSVEEKKSGMVRKFLGADPSLFFQKDEQKIISDHVFHVPFRLEWGSCSGALSLEAFACLGGTPMTLEQAIDYALEKRASMVGWYTDPAALAAPKGTSTLEKYFQQNAGYRFVTSQIKFSSVAARGGSLYVQFSFFNRAKAKNYRPFGIRAYLRSTKEDVALPVWSSFGSHTWPLGPSGPHYEQAS
ncbi:MAG: hypothetical protein RMJ98_19815 [Myxococcales bacterium]|nr:hypothetical protein [Polyangiaceae bacterium]MDW8251548.1 hypothetical protein [Myxococcales bacterium]